MAAQVFASMIRIMKRKWLQVLAVGLCVGGVVPVQARAKKRAKALPTLTPAMLRGKIAYINESEKRLEFSLHIAAPDGTGDRSILSSSAPWNATLTPGLARFIVSNRKADHIHFEGENLQSTNLDGSGKRQITFWPRHVMSRPAFSPDGRFFAYTCSTAPYEGVDPQEGSAVCVSPVQGGSQHLVTQRIPGEQPGASPRVEGSNFDGFSGFLAWSRDGQRILYSYAPHATDDSTLQVVNVKTLEHRPYDNHWWDFRLPEVSPNGKERIVPRSAETPTSAYQEFFLENKAGRTRRLTFHRYNPSVDFFYQLSNPSWSPDGRRILFERLLVFSGSPKPNRRQLCIMSPQSKEIRVLAERRDLQSEFHAFWLQ